MAKSPASEIFTTLKSYAQKLSDGERTPAEVATALNDWARESADSVKARIHDEVESAVEKMGFVKREEFDALVAEVKAMKKSPMKKSPVKKASVKKTPVKRPVAKKKVVKK
jgi:BMFP domain-containing protein YqiC